MKSYANITEIERCSGLSEKEFYNKYVKNSLPVVITDKAQWTSLEKFTPEYFKTNFNHVTKTVDGKIYSLSEIIDLCMASTPTNKAPYPNIYDIPQNFPDYLNDITEINYGKTNRIFSYFMPKRIANQSNQRELFFGGYGCSFPTLHIDYNWVHTRLTQIIGEKDFFLLSPEQTPYLYAEGGPQDNYSPINVLKPDYEKYPLSQNVKVLTITLKPGETIFIPSGWWHTTYIHNFNLTYAMDYVNAFNWDIFMDKNYLIAKKHYPKFAGILKIYKAIMGRFFNLKEYFSA